MAATVLSSPRAVAMSVYVIRAFVKMREETAANAAILKRLAEIDKTLLIHDSALREIVQKLRPLFEPPPQPPKRRPRKLPSDVAVELEKATGGRRTTAMSERLANATRAYERERYEDARRLLRPLVDQAPESAAVRELLGLTEYRRGKWREAIKHLEAFRALTGSVEQHPVLADSYRAVHKHRPVDELWDELRAASPSAELVAEGRIVAAGAQADRGRVDAAIRLLEAAPRAHRPKEHHLRLWYALADLYERAGDVPRARELFRRVVRHEPDLADAAERLAALD